MRAVGLELGPRTLLQDVTFDVPRGSRVALIGPSGAGKTSILNALLGFAPVSGTVLVDGVPLSTLEPAAWREQVALVSQHPYLVGGSLAENLRLAKPEATDAELLAVLGGVGADFVNDLPGGLGAVLAEGGANLSGGERAKLSLARALLKDAPLWLLDEPTAHLDPEAETNLRAALRRAMPGRTVVMATHRLEALEDVERVVELRAGQVISVTHTHTLLEPVGRGQ